MTREEAIKIIECYDIGFYDLSGEKIPADKLADAFDMAIDALKADDEDEPQFCTEDDYWNGMFTESAEAYKAWTGEEMGKTSDEINEMNREIIKDILKMMPTAYLLEALGVSTFEELTEQADRPIKAIQDCRNCKYAKYNERYSEYFCYHNGECVNYDLWESGEKIADRPHGEWIVVAYQKDGEEYIRSCTCSECGSKSALRTNFCPNCGAKMGGDDE